jgi:glutamine synthetase
MDTAVEKDSAYTKALLRTLSFAGVKFVRYGSVDPFNKLRCKVVPVNTLKTNESLDYQVAFAKAVFGGLPGFTDIVQPASGLDATGTLLFRPDISTLRILPYASKSAMILGTLDDQITGRISDFCCRGLLQNVLRRAADEHNIGFNVGAELEFLLYDNKTNCPVDFSNFAESQILNQRQDFITELYDQLAQQDINVEVLHAESSPGQLEIVLPYMRDPVSVADHVLLARETVKALSRAHGMKALFLPKTNLYQAGNGCHMHFSIRDVATGENIFAAQTDSSREAFFHGSKSDISLIGQHFMEGILEHLPALIAVTLPTENSFRRVGQGCWTGHEAKWGFDDKEASLRVVANNQKLAWEHVEFKLCDNHANLYLALACIIVSGLDGVVNTSELRPPRHQDKEARPIPTSLNDSLACMEKDGLLSEFVGKSLMKAYVAVRRAEVERAMTLDQEVEEALTRA